MNNDAKCLLPQQVMSLASVYDLSTKNTHIVKATATFRAKAEKKAVKTKGMRILKKAPTRKPFAEPRKDGKWQN